MEITDNTERSQREAKLASEVQLEFIIQSQK